MGEKLEAFNQEAIGENNQPSVLKPCKLEF
jgi:hypothetical protein